MWKYKQNTFLWKKTTLSNELVELCDLKEICGKLNNLLFIVVTAFEFDWLCFLYLFSVTILMLVVGVSFINWVVSTIFCSRQHFPLFLSFHTNVTTLCWKSCSISFADQSMQFPQLFTRCCVNCIGSVDAERRNIVFQFIIVCQKYRFL